MAGTMNFKCPGCGAYLEFDPQKQEFVCAYCGAKYQEAEIAAFSAKEQEKAEREAAGSARLKEYHCTNCGAEIVTGETTAATRCYFCHNPVVISDRTPWRDLETVSAGWDLPLEEEAFRKVLQRCIDMDNDEYQRWRAGAGALWPEKLQLKKLLATYLGMFRPDRTSPEAVAEK